MFGSLLFEVVRTLLAVNGGLKAACPTAGKWVAGCYCHEGVT